MRAVVVTADHKVAVVEKKLRPLENGEALLQMECCGVCHTDMHIRDGDHGDKTGLILGHEGIGIVKEVGPGVTSLKVGDRTSVAWMYSACGVCEYCNSGKETYCAQIKGSAFDVDGAMAEECIVKAAYSVKVPEGLDSAVASSITCAGVTTYKAIKVSKVRPGQWIAIYGLGGLGNLALQYAKNVYNARVIAIDINEGQLKFAKEMGAEIIINPRNEDPAKVIQEKVGGAHAAVVTAVATQAYESAVGSLRRLGRLVGVGVPNDDLKISIPELLPMGITITTSVVGTRTDLAEAFEFAKKGIVKPKVTMRRMDEVNEIFDEMEKGKFQGRMVVDLKKK